MIEAVASDLGDMEVLVNNAAHDERHRLENITDAYFEDRVA